MSRLFDSVTDLSDGAEVLRRRRYGVIEVADRRFCRVVLRPLPKIVTAPGILLLGGWHHRHRPGDRLRLYYNQPRRFPNFLVLKYVLSARQTTMGTLTRALAALDEIARLKRSDALLCDVGNWRISTKLMSRWGWKPHSPSRWHRHYIKRFYGEYPPPAPWIVSAAEPVEATVRTGDSGLGAREKGGPTSRTPSPESRVPTVRVATAPLPAATATRPASGPSEPCRPQRP